MKEKTMKRNKPSQLTMVLDHLETEGSITSLEAIDLYGATRLADIIFRLRKMGYDIQTITCTGKTRFGATCTYAKYVMKEEN